MPWGKEVVGMGAIPPIIILLGPVSGLGLVPQLVRHPMDTYCWVSAYIGVIRV